MYILNAQLYNMTIHSYLMWIADDNDSVTPVSRYQSVSLFTLSYLCVNLYDKQDFITYQLYQSVVTTEVLGK